MELSLLHGAATVDERLETRVQNWLQAEPEKKTREYVLKQVFQDWKVHGEPGSKLGENGLCSRISTLNFFNLRNLKFDVMPPARGRRCICMVA